MTDDKLETLLSLFYRSTNIPISYYQNGGCRRSHVPVVFEPDIAYCFLKNAVESPDSKLGYASFHDTCVGYIPISQTHYLLVGPVSEKPVTHKQCIEILRTLNVSLGKAADLEYLLRKIPITTRARFLSTLNFLNFLLKEDCQFFPSDFSGVDVLKEPDSPEFNNPPEDNISSFHNTLEIEQQLLNAIAFGKTEYLTQLLIPMKDAAFTSGQLAGNGLREIKNIFISSTAIVSRLAVQKGMNYDQALTLSDYYIQKIELMTNTQEIIPFLGRMMLDYCERIRKLNQSESAGPLTRAVINDIRLHIYRPLALPDIAERVGYSVSYLSAVFKKEMGISVKEFIQNEKIEEAKFLLLQPEATIAGTAEQLCYSSISHFQTAFKKISGMTPGQYLKQNRSL
jgi:AraC-like DNA-binding protein